MSNQIADPQELTVDIESADTGKLGQKLLISGKSVALRQWDEQPGDGGAKSASSHHYEVVGYVLEGRAELTIDGKTITLEPGVSWVVPQNAEHSYRILEPFKAIEATNPPARGYRSGL